MKYLLDTHVWLWVQIAPGNLSTKIRSIVESGKHELLLSAISIAEFATLIEKKKLQIAVSLDEWTATALQVVPVTIVPVTEHIACETGRLLGFNHFDPADRILVATARIEGAVLLTRDRVLHDYAKVKTLW